MDTKNLVNPLLSRKAELVSTLTDACIAEVFPAELPVDVKDKRNLIGLCARFTGELLDNEVQPAIMKALRAKLEIPQKGE